MLTLDHASTGSLSDPYDVESASSSSHAGDDASTDSPKQAYNFGWVYDATHRDHLPSKEDLLQEALTHEEMSALIEDVASKLFQDLIRESKYNFSSSNVYTTTLRRKISAKYVSLERAPHICKILQDNFNYTKSVPQEEMSLLDESEKFSHNRSRRIHNRDIKLFHRKFYQALALRVLGKLQEILEQHQNENEGKIHLSAELVPFTGPSGSLSQGARCTAYVGLCAIPVIGWAFTSSWGNCGDGIFATPSKRDEDYPTWVACYPDANKIRGLYDYYKITLTATIREPIVTLDEEDVDG